MRQADEKEIAFNVWFGVSRVANSWFQMMAGRDAAKRDMAAGQIYTAALSKFRGLMLFGADSMPVDQSVVEPLIRGELLGLGPLTYNAARAGHQETRRDAHKLIADRIVEQLSAFMILVDDPSENIFSDMGAIRAAKRRA